MLREPLPKRTNRAALYAFLPCRSRRGEDWFGAPAAARYPGIYLTTLYRLINAGELPAYQIGRVIRLRRVEVDAYIERSRVRPGELDHLYGPEYVEPGGED